MPALSPEGARFLFDQASELVDQQRSDLAELRARAGVLLSAVSVSTAFLGTVVLQRVADWSIVEVGALAFFVLTSGACIIVLLPTSDWIFGLGAKVLADHFINADGLPCYAELAEHRERHFEKNERKLKNKYSWFLAACCFLALDVGMWLWAMYRLPPPPR